VGRENPPRKKEQGSKKKKKKKKKKKSPPQLEKRTRGGVLLTKGNRTISSEKKKASGDQIRKGSISSKVRGFRFPLKGGTLRKKEKKTNQRFLGKGGPSDGKTTQGDGSGKKGRRQPEEGGLFLKSQLTIARGNTVRPKKLA